MIVAIHAYEGEYQGLHGIESYDVIEVNDLKEANEVAYEMASEVFQDYCYDDDNYEEVEPELLWDIWEIKDVDSNVKLNDLSGEYYNDPEGFLSNYVVEELC